MEGERKAFEIKRYEKYAGYCYDGPHEGLWVVADQTITMLYAQTPLWWKPLWSRSDITPGVDLHQIIYRWSDPLKKWVALNMK